MATIEITSTEEFEKVIKSGVALVDFSATWCAPCRSQEPIIENLAGKLKERAIVGAMNIDNHRELAEKFGIQGVPTLIIFKKGKERLIIQDKPCIRCFFRFH